MIHDSIELQKDREATRFMIMDMLEGILNYSDHPGQMGRYLTETIRELVGGKIIALFQHVHGDLESHRLISITPERYKNFDGLNYFEDLCACGHDIKKSTLWTKESGSPKIKEILDKIECDSIVAIPLSVADHRMGILFIVQLLDKQRIKEILRSFDSLAPVVGLVLRNALFYESQEEIIFERTHDLAISEHRFRTLADFAPVGIFRFTADRDLVFVNRKWSEITGLSQKDADHDTWKSIIHPDDREFLMKHFTETVSSKKAFSVQYRIKRHDGKIITVIGEGVPEYEQNGEFCGYIGTLIDITEKIQEQQERQKLEKQLNQSQKMESIGRLAGGIAHDFNNLLSVIIGYSDLILENLEPGNEFFEEISEISHAAIRSKEMTSQLLTFSRKQVIDPKPMSLGNLLPQKIKTLKRLIGEDIELEIKIGDKGWLINSDPTQLDQLIMNLAVNARDAMPDGGRIRIETLQEDFDEEAARIYPGMAPGAYVSLMFSDDGMGIPKDTLPHIFEPFFTTKEKGKGTGLGLATVYGIVNQNKGFINTYSEEGHGTAFKILIPAFPEYENPIHKKNVSPVRGGTGLILLVEDDEALRNMTKLMLTNLGYDVIAFAWPEQAIEFCRKDKRQIDCLLSDVIMPGMNGRDMAIKIKIMRPDIKVLFMSGYPEDIISDKGVLKKGVSFIHKPFMLRDFAAKINDVISSGS